MVNISNVQVVAIKVELQEDVLQISKYIYGYFVEYLGWCIYGGFYVGEDSDILNIVGVCMDVVEVFRELLILNLCWLGGCFVDIYYWKDGIGLKEECLFIFNIWWGNVWEDNSFGIYEFFNMCELLGIEFYLLVNVGSGIFQELVDWIKYINYLVGISFMLEFREEYGCEEFWKVIYWGIGNEVWGCGGNMILEYYLDVYWCYVIFIIDWCNFDGLVWVVFGVSSSDYNWIEVLMKNIFKNFIEVMVLYYYLVIDWGNKGLFIEFFEGQYFIIMEWVLLMEEFIQKYIVIMDKYDLEQKVVLFVDEWGGWYDLELGINFGFLYQQNIMCDVMIVGIMLNIFNNYVDWVKMVNLVQAVNVLQVVILIDEEKMIFMLMYYVMWMYKVYQDVILILLFFEFLEYMYEDKFLLVIFVFVLWDVVGNIYFFLVNIDLE